MKITKRNKIIERSKASESQVQKLANALKSPEWVRFCFEVECG